MSGELIDPFAKGFDDQGVLHEDFSAPVASNFAAVRYMSDPATSRVAGPFFDSSPYNFYVLSVPRHDNAELVLDLVSYGPVDSDSSEQSVNLVIDDRQPITAVLQGTSGALSAGPTTGGRSLGSARASRRPTLSRTRCTA